MPRSPLFVIALMTVVALGLVGLMWYGYVLPIKALARGLDVPDVMVAGYDQRTMEALRLAYLDTPAAGDILRAMHFGPDMVLPVAIALPIAMAFFVLLPGRLFYGRLMDRRHALAAALLPLGYMIADYAENAASLMFFPPANPGVEMMVQLAGLLPWLTSLKFMFLLISLLVIARFLPGYLRAGTSNN